MDQNGSFDLASWRKARKEALSRTPQYESCSPTARQLARHMVTSRDDAAGRGMFRSPRKLAKEFGKSERTIRYCLSELVSKGVFEKELRKDPRGTGRRDTTSIYRLHPALNIKPGYLASLGMQSTFGSASGMQPLGMQPIADPVADPLAHLEDLRSVRSPIGQLEAEPNGSASKGLPALAGREGQEQDLSLDGESLETDSGTDRRRVIAGSPYPVVIPSSKQN